MPTKEVVIKGAYPDYEVDCVEVKDSDLSSGQSVIIKWSIHTDSDADLAKVCFTKAQWDYFGGNFEYAFIVRKGDSVTKEMDIKGSRNIGIELRYDIWCGKEGSDDVEAKEGKSCTNTSASKKPRIRLRDVQAKALTADYTKTQLTIGLEEAVDSSVVRIFDGATQAATQAAPIEVISDFPSDVELQPGLYRVVLEENGIADQNFELRVEAAPVVLVPLQAPQGSGNAGPGGTAN